MADLVRAFLDGLQLPQYTQVLIDHGWDSCERLTLMTEADMAEMGDVIKPGHRAHILQGIGQHLSAKLTGYLIKQGGGTRLIGRKNMKKRWFVLEGSMLSYYLSPASSTPLKNFRLNLTGCAVSVFSQEHFTFAIRAPLDSRRSTFMLQAQTADEMARWVSALRCATTGSRMLVFNYPDRLTLSARMTFSNLTCSSPRSPSTPALVGMSKYPRSPSTPALVGMSKVRDGLVLSSSSLLTSPLASSPSALRPDGSAVGLHPASSKYQSIQGSLRKKGQAIHATPSSSRSRGKEGHPHFLVASPQASAAMAALLASPDSKSSFFRSPGGSPASQVDTSELSTTPSPNSSFTKATSPGYSNRGQHTKALAQAQAHSANSNTTAMHPDWVARFESMAFKPGSDQ
eukprot:g10452.t1